MFDPFISFVREIYGNENVPLHRPLFSDEEENRVAKAIKSNFVSSAGQDIEVFEGEIANFTGARHAVATVMEPRHYRLQCMFQTSVQETR